MKKIAVISVTSNGALLADKLKSKMVGEDYAHFTFFVNEQRNPLHNGSSYSSIKTLVGEIFTLYDAFVCIMATGIAVRAISPHIVDKRTDPAVIVIDEAGQFAISLLSGHIGGANELTKKIAAAIGATPVITTATDIAGKPAADILAVKLNLKIEPFTNLKTINAAIVNGDSVSFFIDSALPQYQQYVKRASALGIHMHKMEIFEDMQTSFSVLVTDKTLTERPSLLFLRPPSLAVGIGCRRGTKKEEILMAIEDACKTIGRSSQSIGIIGSSIVKETEKGLLEALDSFGLKGTFYTNQQLEHCIYENNLTVSTFVEAQIGVGNVCEAAAILAAQNSQLLLTKTKYPNITIAIAQVNCLL